MEKNNQFFVTHFVLEDPPAEGMRRIAFYTTTPENLKSQPRRFFSGYGYHKAFTEEELAMMVKSRSVVELPNPVKTMHGKGVWMDSDENVWLASSSNPYVDKERIKVFNLNQKRFATIDSRSGRTNTQGSRTVFNDVLDQLNQNRKKNITKIIIASSGSANFNLPIGKRVAKSRKKVEK